MIKEYHTEHLDGQIFLNIHASSYTKSYRLPLQYSPRIIYFLILLTSRLQIMFQGHY